MCDGFRRETKCQFKNTVTKSRRPSKVEGQVLVNLKNEKHEKVKCPYENIPLITELYTVQTVALYFHYNIFYNKDRKKYKVSQLSELEKRNRS